MKDSTSTVYMQGAIDLVQAELEGFDERSSSSEDEDGCDENMSMVIALGQLQIDNSRSRSAADGGGGGGGQIRKLKQQVLLLQPISTSASQSGDSEQCCDPTTAATATTAAGEFHQHPDSWINRTAGSSSTTPGSRSQPQQVPAGAIGETKSHRQLQQATDRFRALMAKLEAQGKLPTQHGMCHSTQAS